MARVEILGEWLVGRSRFQENMETQKFCIYNLTRERLVRLEVDTLDTTIGTLKTLVDAIGENAGKGLWLRPYRGIPSVPGLRPFDLICLDDGHRVTEMVQSLSTVELAPLEGVAASALILPSGSIRTSMTEAGDRFAICLPEDMESRLERGTVPTSAESDLIASTSKAPELADPAYSEQTSAWKSRLQRWLVRDRRRARRYANPELVAFCWTGAAPAPRRIENISDTGMFLLTDERWLPGTMIAMTLQKANTSGDDPQDAISIQTRVVRWGADGEGLDFILPAFADSDPSTGLTGERALKRFLRQL
ncbi:MAG TPA: PilZ domain-containing protein [Terracidiphilus sp.]|nr:PilZ domain-containing protein [Terracidiphilus sp.]